MGTNVQAESTDFSKEARARCCTRELPAARGSVITVEQQAQEVRVVVPGVE
jgi:hypothetical protein